MVDECFQRGENELRWRIKFYVKRIPVEERADQIPCSSFVYRPTGVQIHYSALEALP